MCVLSYETNGVGQGVFFLIMICCVGLNLHFLLMIYYCLYERVTIFYGRIVVPRNLVYVSELGWG